MAKQSKKKKKNNSKNNKEVVVHEPSNPNTSEVLKIDSNLDDDDKNTFEVYPIIEASEEENEIRVSRKLNSEEVKAIKNRNVKNTAHIHPSIIEAVLEDEERKEIEKKKTRKRVFKKRIVYAILWIYFIVRVLVTDIDYLIVDKLFGVSVFYYSLGRIAVVAAFLLVIWKKVGNKRFWKTFLSFLSFPVYPGFWQVLKSIAYTLPKYLIEKRQSYLLYVYIEWIVELIVRFKTRILGYLLFCSGVFISMFSDNEILLFISIALLLVSQWRHLSRRWNELFGPLKIFQIKLTPISKDSEPISIEKLESQIKETVSNQGEKGKNTIVKEVEQYVLYNELLTALDVQVKKVLSSQSYLKNFVIKSFVSFVYAIVVFGCINYNLYKINPVHFNLEGLENVNVGIFEFTYYSFFNIFSEGVDITPTTRIAKSIRMLGVFVGVIINFLILAVYFTVNTARYKENLEGVNIWTQHYSKKLNDQMKDKFSRDSDENKNWLQDQGSSISKQINDLKNFFDRKNKYE